MPNTTSTTSTRETKATREAAHVAAYLARRGWVECDASSYAAGQFRVLVAIPEASRNGRKRVNVVARRAA
jgi:hypothetical protein